MSTDEEQVRYLEDAIKIVREQAFYMKRAMDNENLKLALEHATEMLRELRTSLLTPKNYYELYMKIMDEMRELEEYIYSLERGGKSIVEIYESVQCCANIVPRLYLLCCVGGVYIASKEAPAKDILKDLIEMIKGVQHPTRGLFLRHYLQQITKSKLPDVGSPYEGVGGNIEDAYTFLLQNFAETNRLWVRLQTQGAAKDKKKREKERLDLRILVGTNLVRISQLEGLDVSAYKSNVLPKILEEVVSCKDTIAQSYLMDCIIQVFPDDFHLATLEPFLKTCSELKEKVNVRTILETLMNRLATHALQGVNSTEVNSFKLFNDCITTLIEDRSNMSLTETLRLQTVLTNFALKCHPSRIDYVAHCLNTSSSLIEKTEFVSTIASENPNERSTNETTIQIEELLSSPLRSLALKVLDINGYAKLMTYLPWGNWKEVAATLLKSVIASNTPLSEPNQVNQLFDMITPLIRDKEGTVSSNDEDRSNEQALSQKFKEEQNLVSRLPHLLKSTDTDVMLRMLVIARTKFAEGGASRMRFTFPSLVFAALLLARKVFERESAIEKDSELPAPQFSTRKVFHFVIEVITALATSHPEPALKLFLNAAQATDECGYHAISYEFLKEALLIYENDISDSKLQVNVLTSVIGTLLKCKHFPVEDYEALITKVAQYANKLLKKADQCRMVSLCSHLFWPKGSTDDVNRYNDCDRVLECMQRSLKIASVCNPNLFVEILDRYLYYFENDNPIIHVRYLSGLIALINEQATNDQATVVMTPAVEAHYKNTLDYIRSRQQASETSEKFSEIQL
eukprot:gene12178-16310_t